MSKSVEIYVDVTLFHGEQYGVQVTEYITRGYLGRPSSYVASI